MPLINDCHKWKWTVSEDVGFSTDLTGWIGFTLRFTADFMWACKLINDATQGISDFIDQLMALWDKIRVFFGAPTVNYYVTWEWFESICITSGLSTVGENYKDDAREAIGVQKDGYFVCSEKINHLITVHWRYVCKRMKITLKFCQIFINRWLKYSGMCIAYP